MPADRRQILIVSYDFPPIQGPGIWRSLGFARHLPALGWTVRVACSDRNYWHSRTDPALLERIPDGVGVHRVRGIPWGARFGRVLPERIAGPLRWRFPEPLLIPILKLAAHALAVASPGSKWCVLTSGPPHVVHLVGLILKRLRGCTWIADYRDLWMDDPVLAWKGGYQRALGHRAERAVMQEADLVVTVTPTWRDLLAARRAGRPTVLIRNAADFDGIELPQAERPWQAGGPVLLFPGTPYTDNGPPALFDGIRRHLVAPGEDRPRCRFAFLGLHGDFRTRVADWGLGPHVLDLGPQPHARTLALMQGADGILVPLRHAATTGGAIPAKAYEAMALGKPILLVADPAGDAAELARAYGRAVIASSTDAEDVARALDTFARQPASDVAAPVPAALAGWSRQAAAMDLDRAIRGLETGEPFSPTCP